MGKLKNCPQCGYKTIRDFCTPQCRMEDSDNRIEGVEDERDRLIEVLIKIQEITPTVYDSERMTHKIINEVLNDTCN